jgi:ubiquinone biosynthesis protein UbiJ
MTDNRASIIGSMGLSPEELEKFWAEVDEIKKRAAATDRRIEKLQKDIARTIERLTRIQKRLERYC